jgi:hypothetical protein
MFSYTVLFNTPKHFGHYFEHIQGVVKEELKQYASD